MRKICYVVAMRSEAAPLIEHFHLEEQEGFFAPLPCLLYRKDDIFLALPGVQHERDLIGCEAAAMLTALVLERLHPDMVINSGTCGAWGRYGMSVGQVCLGSGAMFHDRHVPGDNAWDTQGLGNYSVWGGVPQLAKALNLSLGKVTTGSSFDLTDEEETLIHQHGGRLKDMEGAAVAFVCSLYQVPVVLIKGITNLRDAAGDDMEDFQKNLAATARELLRVNKEVYAFLTEVDE